MAEMRFTDISNLPEVRRLAEEVKESNKPRVLRTDAGDIAVLKPVSPTRRRKARVKTEADREAFRSAAGAWRDNVDVEKFLKDNEASRRISSRPKVEL